MRPLHIVQIYKDYYPVLGGIENHLRTLAAGLAARGHQVTVLVTNTAGEDIVEQSGRLTVIKAGRLGQLASTPFSLSMSRHARRITGAEIVHLHMPFPPGDLVARLIQGRPALVVSYHSDIVRQRNLLRLYAPLLRRTLARAQRIIVGSPAYSAGSPWLGPHEQRLTVVPYSVDAARFADPDPAQVAAWRARLGRPLALFVGRLRYYKGLHYLIAALTQTRIAVRLAIAGSGPAAAHLQAQVDAGGLSGQVVFLGDVADADLPALYAAADLFVLPSHLRAEAFGIVLLEAQAAGLPLISCELGSGTSFVNRHGVTGLVVPPADPAALAHALDALAGNPALAQQMGQAGQQRVNAGFTVEHLLTRIERVYVESV